MGCTGSKTQKTVDDKTSIEVEQQLIRERVESLYCFKILLLGAGESGKSTVLKQLRLIHNKKLNKQELDTVADSLHQNVIDCMRALLHACREKFGYELDDDQDKDAAQKIQEFKEGTRLTPEFGQLVTRFFNSKAIQQTYARRSEFWLLDACSYYMKNLERFCDPDFVPTEEDAVFSRIRTTGIVVTNLEQKLADVQPGEPDSIKLEVVDVGGQRNERRKWIHCFDDVKAILFIESLAGYNQVLFEDSTKNRMHESLELFKEITHRVNFKDTPIFLFLNKKDLFEQMIQEVGLEHCFPDYHGSKHVQEALSFIEEKFKAQAPAGKNVKVLPVTSVMKRDIRQAFEEVKADLIANNRKLLQKELAQLAKQAEKLDKQAQQ